MVDTISKRKCTGCKMCGDICQQNAIYFITDEEGFWYPQIDPQKCNECGLCERKCPSLHPEINMQMNKIDVYAAWSKSSTVRDESTSGGVFWEIATKFIENNGVVVGTVWNEDHRSASFCVAEDIEKLEALRGSKYIQSDTSGIYNVTKKYVGEGRKVLFCGTPCQNAAVRSFLDGNNDNVYYLDFICRNINSPKALEAYVCDMERVYGSKVTFIRQKSKKRGWQCLATDLIFENGAESLLDRNEDPWIKGFIQNDLYTRDCCFECQYRTLPRKCSDITVGDFWGINNVSTYELYKGVSVVLVNNDRGRYLLDEAKKNLFIEKRSVEDVLNGNSALLENPEDNGKKQKFFTDLQELGFLKSVENIIGQIKQEDDSPEKCLERDKIKYKHNGQIDEKMYIYLNYECNNVVRKGKAKLIPYQNVILDMKEDAKIILEGDNDFEVGINLLNGSRAETLIRLDRNAKILLHHGGCLFYGTTIEVKNNALFEAGFFSVNTGSVFVITKKVLFGEDVMLGRNIMIYDSDFHQILDAEGKQVNYPQEVIVEDHVWLTCNINVNKGVCIKEGSIVASQTVVGKDVPEYALVAGHSFGTVVKNDMRWSRTSVKRYEQEIQNKKIILYGFGVEGKKFYDKHKEHIRFVIDNKQKEDMVITFDEFQKRGIDVIEDTNDWVGVIAAPNYYEALYTQLRACIPGLLILSYAEV